MEILKSAAEFNDVGNAYQGKGLTLWCGGQEVERLRLGRWRFLRFMGNDIFGGLIDGRMYPARILVILCKPAARLLDR